MDLHDIFLASTLMSGSGGSIDLSDYYSKSEVDQRIIEKISEIVANAPEDFDTLKEMSDWISEHEDSAAAMNSVISANTLAIANKVDKVLNKGLSTNDFTNADKSKLDSLEGYNITEISSQTAINKSTLGYQRKNLLKNTANSQTKNGVTFTVNEDGSVTVNGTASEFISLPIFGIPSDLQGKRLTLTGCPSGGNYQTGFALYGNKKSDQNTFIKDVGDGDTAIVPNEDCGFYILVRKNATVNNLTFYPMLRFADITDDTYEPYRPSVQEQIDNKIVVLDSEEEFDALTAKTAAFYFIKEEEE